MMLEYPALIGRMVGFDRLRDDLHGEWLKSMLLGVDDMTLQSHRGSYKTTCLSVALATMLLLWPDKNVIFMRKTDADVVEVVKQVQGILSGDVYGGLSREIYGSSLTLPQATGTQITTSVYCAPRGASQLLGIGIGGSLTGKHADVIITDDIINLTDRVSRAERMRTRSIYQELQNVRNPGGRIINTGTPWHPEDAFGIMPPAVRYDCYSTGLLTEDKLAQLRRSMAPSLFAANYELRHIAAENALFATDPGTTDNAAMLWDGVAHIDAAYEGEDYTALTCGRRIGGKLYLYGRIWRAHVDTVMDAILADCDRLRCAPIYCETNGDKGYLAREMRARGAAVRPYSEKMNKYYKISTFLRKWWGNVVFLAGTDPAYIAQIMDYNEQAEHDDAPDSAACICRVLDRKVDL
ncbi:MAG: hypothetical protein IKK34_14465 [Clostridia bacterium]|nr:hypothetical protein [Clostridia bacterium]